MNIARLTTTGALTDFDPGLSAARCGARARHLGLDALRRRLFQQIGGRPRMGYAQFTQNLAPVVLDTVDDTAPTSAVQPLDGVQERALFAVEWAGEDEGAGVRDYSVFVAADGGPFMPWRTNTAATTAMFLGEDGAPTSSTASRAI